MTPKLILASASPRRAKILNDLGIEFSIFKTEAEEVAYPGDPERTVKENALAKNRSAREKLGEDMRDTKILSADTIVWFNGKIYGKPKDLDEAREFLRELSGNTHIVFTAASLDGDVKITKSEVKFRKLDDAKIEEYISKVKPIDRAGAYDIDESGDLIVEGYSGSYENIMGLAVEPIIEWALAKKAPAKILLHSCCGPCASGAIPRLKELGYDVTMYFSNSNIDSLEEYNRRLEAAQTLARAEGIELIADEYDHSSWLEKVAKGLENEPEKGARCKKCFKFNLERTRDKAKERKFGKFTTSLTISPHKPSAVIFASLEDENFLKEDFKKRGGFLLSTNRAKELGLYRQSYCGCEFSKRHLKAEGEENK